MDFCLLTFSNLLILFHNIARQPPQKYENSYKMFVYQLWVRVVGHKMP